MLGQIERGRRQLRWVAGAVVMLQFASATWVPVLHPYIHPDPPPPQAANHFTAQSDKHEQGSALETSCFICANGPGFSAVGDQRLPLEAEVPLRLPVNTAVPRSSSHRDTPANAARAPPKFC
jgi:hypothetical protein